MDAPKTSRESDRRQATVLFADIAGYTAWSERTDPEDVAEMLNGVYKIIEPAVIRRGGTVDNWIGDCGMALFGAPLAVEDAPRCAVNAAIEIRNQLERFLAARGLSLQLGVHVGVNTGLVFAGIVGGETKNKFSVQGAAVNLASRLANAATSGQIIVGPETYRHTSRDFEFRPTKPLKLKGIEESTVAYEVLSREERLHRASPATGAFVGRHLEVRTLEESLANLRAGKGGVVSVVGVNGMGKSRLLAELHGGDSARGLRWIEGRSISVGQGLSFHPFVDLFGHWAAIPDGAGHEQATKLLATAVRDTCGAAHEDIYPFIATLMGYPLASHEADRLAGVDGDALEKLIRASVRRLLELDSEREPLVLVFEDLHWADQSSLGLLEILLPLCTSRPILFLDAMRPEYPATTERILRFAERELASHHVEVRLNSLEERECESLIRQTVDADDLPRAMLTLIKEKSEGNPFYVEEVVRALRESGALLVEKGRVRYAAAVPDIELPGTIAGVVLSRVDRLPEDARRVLQVGAVIGRRFRRRILERVAPAGVDLDPTLQALVEKKFLRESDSRRTGSFRRLTLHAEHEYVFEHALIQEAVYESLLRSTRRELHTRCAEVLEDLHADRLEDAYGVLAYHWTRAERLEKAEEYLFKAGEEAARTAASAEALDYFREAYRVYLLRHADAADNLKKAQLEKNIAVALLNTGQLADSIDHFNAALRFYGVWVPKSELALRLRLAFDLSVVLLHLYLGSTARARRQRPNDLDIYATMYNRCRAQNPTDPKRNFFDNIATMRHLHRVDPARVERVVGLYASVGAFFAFAGLSFGVGRRFLDVSRSLVRPDRPSDEFAYRAMATVLDFHAGDWSGANDIDDALLAEGLRSGLLWDADIYLGMVCERELRKGHFERARQILAHVENLVRGYGYGFSSSTLAAMTAYLLLEQRRLPEARAAMQAYYDARHEEPLHVFGLSGLARIEALDGNLDAATQALERAAAIVDRSDRLPAFYVGAFNNSKLLHGVLALERGHADGRAVLRLARRATATAATIARERVEAHRLTGRTYWAIGKRREALVSWMQAVEEGERLSARPEIARTFADFGLAARPARERLELCGLDPATCLSRARTEFAALGLAWELEKLGTPSSGGTRGESVSVTLARA